jgi:hypothetical protein
MDLDPETIMRVGGKAKPGTTTTEDLAKARLASDRQLRQLYLRWSGSNPVLRAWGGPEGLAMLPHLEHIVLSLPPDDKVSINPLHFILAERDSFRISQNCVTVRKVMGRRSTTARIGSPRRLVTSESGAMQAVGLFCFAVKNDCNVTPRPLAPLVL